MMQKLANETLVELKQKIKLLFNVNLDLYLSFDLKGICILGQCKNLGNKSYQIRLHHLLLNEFGLDYIQDVLVHEVAHAVQMAIYKNKVKPHGKEWKEILNKISYKNSKNLSNQYRFFLSKIKQKKKLGFHYTCKCGIAHLLTRIRHIRIKKGIIYKCKKFKSILSFEDKYSYM